MRDRFDDEARRASARADDEARRLGHRSVGTEHLLLGLLGEAGGPVAAALADAGATFEGARHKVAEAVGSGPPVHDGELALTARARRALDRASRFSLQARAPRIGAEHVLLGVLDVEGTAGQVLRGLGVDVVALRKAVDRPAGEAQAPDPAPAVEPAAGRRQPSCPLCGVALAEALTTTYVPARDASGATRDVLVAYCGSCGSALGLPP